MTRTSLSLCLLTCCAIACGPGKSEANNTPPPPSCPPGQYFDGTYCVVQGAGGAPTAGAGGATAGTGGTPTTGGTGGTAPVPTSGCVPAQTLDPAAAAAAAPGLATLLSSSLPAGAQAVGTPFGAQLQQGQCVEMSLQLEPGKCYTVVGAGPSLQNVDVQIVTVTPVPNVQPVLAVDQTVAPQAVIGAKPTCWRMALPMPLQGKIVVRAAAGQGMVAAQVFAK